MLDLSAFSLELSSLASASPCAFHCFSLEAAKQFLQHVVQLLCPGGRFIATVPRARNSWVNHREDRESVAE